MAVEAFETPISCEPTAVTTTARQSRSPRAFSLLEMAMVIMITAILAASAIPAMSSMSAARQGAAAEEVERRIVNARSRALAEGRPFGVTIDATAHTLRTMTVATTGAVPTPATDALGQPEAAFNVAATFSGVTITAVSSEGGTGTQTFWFSHEGTPQARNASGALLGAWTEDATVTVSGGVSVYVQARSGAVTR